MWMVLVRNFNPFQFSRIEEEVIGEIVTLVYYWDPSRYLFLDYPGWGITTLIVIHHHLDVLWIIELSLSLSLRLVFCGNFVKSKINSIFINSLLIPPPYLITTSRHDHKLFHNPIGRQLRQSMRLLLE